MIQRIMVIGGPGSGKSTLGRKLGARLGLPVVHMDPIYWLGDWVERDKTEAMRLAKDAADRPEWVFEGNHSASMAYRAERADLIVFLDMPRVLRMWRGLWRGLRFLGHNPPHMGAECPPRFVRCFLGVFLWDSPPRRPPRPLVPAR
ncbi:MAG: hypothetical protein AB3N22_09215, partial [Ruegeria sp.]